MQGTDLRPTPETDSAAGYMAVDDSGFHRHPAGGLVPVEFARRLERERDEARKEAARWKEAEELMAAGCESEVRELRERIAFLERAIAKQNQEIEQVCGKALGYPWFKDDQKNFPGATEADGVCVGEHVANTIVAELATRYQQTVNELHNHL